LVGCVNVDILILIFYLKKPCIDGLIRGSSSKGTEKLESEATHPYSKNKKMEKKALTRFLALDLKL